MSQLDKIRQFFTDYNGETREQETKHTSFVTFSKKLPPSLLTLLDYQGTIEGVEVDPQKVQTVVNSMNKNLGSEFSDTLIESLTRRFLDDQRNQENARAKLGQNVPKAIRDVVEKAIASGSVEDMETAQQFLQLSNLGETPIAEVLADAIVDVIEDESESEDEGEDGSEGD